MGNYEQLKEAIKAVIKTNGKQEITGQVMQDTLLAITSSFGQGALFTGIATPETNPLTPDQNVFYLASKSGVYPNFNGLSVADGEIVVFSLSNGQWVKQLLSLGGGGSVTIINEPDEEDLTTVPATAEKNVMRFKNRAYDEANASGKGYKILRKYWKEVDGVRKKVLTQDMIDDANTIYEIRYDFDLNGAEIQIKEGCVLNFAGGSLSNGRVIGNNSVIISEPIIIFNNIVIGGTWLIPNIYQSWFDFIPLVNVDNRNNFKNLIQLTNADITNNIFFNDGVYYTKVYDKEDKSEETLFLLNSNTNLHLNDCAIKTIPFKWTHKNIILIKDANNINIYGGKLIGDADTHDYDETISDTHEFSHGIKIKTNSKNITINNTIIEKFTGDGIDLIESGENAIDNIQITNVVCDANNRQGISIESGKNIHIKDSKFINTSSIHETLPSCGIDIEPWIKNVHIENIHIENCDFYNNKKGILIEPNLHEDDKINFKNNIVIRNCTIENQIVLYAINEVSIVNTLTNENIYVKITDAKNVHIDNMNMKDIELHDSINGLNVKNLIIYNRLLVSQQKNVNNVKIENCFIESVYLDSVNNIHITNSEINNFEQHLNTVVTAENNIIKHLNRLTGGNITLLNNKIDYYNRDSTQFGGVIKNNIITIREQGLNLLSSIVENNILIKDDNNITLLNEYAVKNHETQGVFEYRYNKIQGFKYLIYNNIIPKTCKVLSLEPLILCNDIENIQPLSGCIALIQNNLRYYLNGIWYNVLLISKEEPSSKYKGQYHFNSVVNLPTFWDGTKWVNSSGNAAYLNKGDTQQRPTLTNADDGFEYYDTILKKKILWNGIAWVNMDGTVL